MRTFFSFCNRYKWLGFSALALLFIPDLVFAQGTNNETLKNFAQIAASLVHIISALAIILVQFFPPLWGSELITGDQVTEGYRFMWVYVRNLCNIAFVGLILFVALSNLFTAGAGIKGWNIKDKLGPIILGLVAINFSLLAMRVLVDVVHVGTVALLAIPDPLIEARGVGNIADFYDREVDTRTFEPCTDGSSPSGGECKPVYEIINDTFCPSGQGSDNCTFEIMDPSGWRSQAEAMSNPERKNIMLAFGTFFMKLESLPILSADAGGLLDVLDSTLFSIIFGLAYLLALIAIFVVLLVRVVLMWLFIIFSPILMMSWVLGFSTGMLGEQFWKYLLVPLKAAGALAFGFVMIAAMEGMLMPGSVFVNVIDPGPPLEKFWGPDEFGGWHMLWKVLTVILFWKIVFDIALSGLEGVDKVVGGIKGFGEKMGGAALTMAADQVKFPNPMGEGEISAAQFLPGGSMTPNAMASAYTRSTRSGTPTDPVGDASALAAVDRQMRNWDGASERQRRDTLSEVGAEQLSRAIAAAEGDERERLIERIRDVFPGFTVAAGANADTIEASLHAADRDNSVFPAAETPEPAAAPPAPAAEPTVNVGDTEINIDVPGSPDIQLARNLGQDEVVTQLTAQREILSDARLREIYEGMERSGWTATDVDAFIAQIRG